MFSLRRVVKGLNSLQRVTLEGFPKTTKSSISTAVKPLIANKFTYNNVG